MAFAFCWKYKRKGDLKKIQAIRRMLDGEISTEEEAEELLKDPKKIVIQNTKPVCCFGAEIRDGVCGRCGNDIWKE